MAPKKKQQQQQQQQQQQYQHQQNKQKSKNNKKNPSSSSTFSTSSSSTAGARLHLSAENEQRIRRLLLNKSSAGAGGGGDTLRPTATLSDETVSLSRSQKAKKLKCIYEKLSCEGFSDDQIEIALSVLKDTATFEAALDWLCLNLSRDDLPLKFANQSSLHMDGEGAVSVVSSALENWTPLLDTSAETKDKQPSLSVRMKGKWVEDSLDSREPSQADWIRQYMEKEEEVESGSWEDDVSEDGTSVNATEPRSHDSIVKEYQAARLEAISAKERRDKKGQEKASNIIRRLKQELSSLGLPHSILVFEPGEAEVLSSTSGDVTCKTRTCEYPTSSTLYSEHKDLPYEQRVYGNSEEHHIIGGMESLDVSLGANNEPDVESHDMVLGDLFTEGHPSIEFLHSEVLKSQKKEKARGSFSVETSEALDGIWKKGDPLRIPKAVLHQLCQKAGWDPPKYTKVGRRADGFSYTVSVLRKSTGRGKARKAGGLITIELPDQDGRFQSAEEAQNKVAAYALYRLFPDLPLHLLILEPYASLSEMWEQGESINKVEQCQEVRRSDFVDSLLNVMPSVSITSDVKYGSSNNEYRKLPPSSYTTTADVEKEILSREKESSALRRALENRRKLHRYKAMLEKRAVLPVAKSKNEILHLLKEDNVLVVCGQTGSGKTTQVPQYILDDMIDAGHGGECNIICTQPRRIAAISVAERVADERCEPSPGVDGSLVGYQVRLDSARNEKTKLLFCTTGILLRRIAGDKELDGVSHVIVDEVHERSLLGDFLLMVLRDLIEKQSARGTPTLKVILMSATVDSSLFSRYFANCPIITVEGRTHPVSTYFLEDIYQHINYHLASDSPAYLSSLSGQETLRGPINNHRGKKNLVLSSWGDESLLSDECTNPHYIPSAYQSYNEQTRMNLKMLNEDIIDFDLLEDLVCHIDEFCDEGAILVFLPGISEISVLQGRLAASYRFGGESSEWVLPLHSSVAAVDQKKVFLNPPDNLRKVIIATNIAETSLTIDDVAYVIDSGKHKESRYDPRKKLSSMVEDWISQANAKQRRGRAGRVKPGMCFCLYTRHRFERLMRLYQVPEMLRMPLVELCLQVKLLGSAKSFLLKALEPPKEEAVDSAISLLHEVGAVDKYEELTPLGHHLARLPVDLLLGKMLIYAAIFGCLAPVLSITAVLSHKTPFVYHKNEREPIEKLKLAVLSDKLDGSSNTNDVDGQSDHIVMMVAYRKWEKILQENGVKAAQYFCNSHSLSSSVLYMIRDMRVQFGMLLADIGLVQLPKDYQMPGRKNQNLDRWFSDASQPFNKYAHNSAIIKAILCAGLYPNVAAKVEGIYAPSIGNQTQFLQLATRSYPAWHDGRREVYIHPSSVNNGIKSFHYPFVVFLEKVETNKVFLRDTSVVSPYSLLLFGGSINIQHQIGMVTIDGWLKLTAPAQTAVLFKELRLTLDSVLKDLISHPEREAVNNEVVRSIIHLLLDENKGYKQLP